MLLEDTVDCLKPILNNKNINFISNITEDEIYIDAEGNETADSIDLTPANYKLDPTDKFEWSLFDDDIELDGIYDYFDA